MKSRVKFLEENSQEENEVSKEADNGNVSNGRD